MKLGWILSSLIIFLLQEFISGASLSNDVLRPTLQNEDLQDEILNETPNSLRKRKNELPKKSGFTNAINPFLENQHTSKMNIQNQSIQRKYWSTKAQNENYGKLGTNANIPDHFKLKTSVHGYDVKILSAYKEHNGKIPNNNLKLGHEIEILPVKPKSQVISNIMPDPVIEKQIQNISSEPTGNFPDHLSGDYFETIDSEPDYVSEDDLTLDPVVKENSFKGEKSGRVLEIFSRSNDSSCKTPSGEMGHCRRLSECLLSDALSNFSLFLQYLCMMKGPFVGICCPNNPVIEITDGEESADNTTHELLQPPGGCGQNQNTRIVGGTMSVPHEWTWMVALMRRNRFFCGGVILNDWYVLTAAHCVLGIKVKDLTVRLGEYSFLENNQHQKDLPVAEIKRHAQFVTMTFQHDIALLKLKQKVEYSKFIGSICLPDQNARNFTQANATVVGWGTVSFGGAASPVLRQVTIPVWSNEDCDKTYALESITDSFMCAGSPENGEDACQGDSGGPLMALNSERRWEVIGIVSWGRRCGDPKYPGVYTRVTTYTNWIAENMQ